MVKPPTTPTISLKSGEKTIPVKKRSLRGRSLSAAADEVRTEVKDEFKVKKPETKTNPASGKPSPKTSPRGGYSLFGGIIQLPLIQVWMIEIVLKCM